MTSFDETRHARDRAGKFTSHAGAEQEGTLTGDSPDDFLQGTPECRDPECSQINGECVGMHCTACGQPCSVLGHQGCGAPPRYVGDTESRDVLARRGEEYGDSVTRGDTPWTSAESEDESHPVTDLTATESSTLKKLPLSRLAGVRSRLQAGPAEGYRETGPEQRQEIARQVGAGNLAAISGGRVIPMADGIELPVSAGYSVRVRLAGNDTYTVQPVLTRAGTETVKGERTGVYSDDVSRAAYYASCFRSHGEQEWITAG